MGGEGERDHGQQWQWSSLERAIKQLLSRSSVTKAHRNGPPSMVWDGAIAYKLIYTQFEPNFIFTQSTNLHQSCALWVRDSFLIFGLNEGVLGSRSVSMLHGLWLLDYPWSKSFQPVSPGCPYSPDSPGENMSLFFTIWGPSASSRIPDFLVCRRHNFKLSSQQCCLYSR